MEGPGRGTEEEKTEDKNVTNTKCETKEPQLAAPQAPNFEEPEDPLKFLEDQSALAE